MERWVASRAIRLGTLAAALLSVACLVLVRADAVAAMSGFVRFLAGLFAVLTAVGLIFSTRKGFGVWMGLAQKLQVYVTMFLFGTVYLTVIPFFSVLVKLSDPLRLRKHKSGESYWIERSDRDNNLRSYERMG